MPERTCIPASGVAPRGRIGYVRPFPAETREFHV
ncbi:protein of unknown function [Azospirillum baldaniorum]|uniref:Uncharacterized protein n=1 Tax=Azospirillum baldaniorum TaxID=1064539 RepID=A0A9P1JTG3_9PROT|nr:protein of unknown function [Azospirillum baldaniorum]